MYRKKLIEVALPLEAINKASSKEKSIRHGHPSTLHLWWARRPLAACRAVLFASLVDDPSAHPERFPKEADQEKERQRLFGIIERLVLWENINNRVVLNEAKTEILKSSGGKPPAIYDPFCGGGSIPLEAQRLGLEAHASDLNPVAVLITKALIELPSKFANRAPANPHSRKKGMKDAAYPGALGLAEDVRYYGEWMADKAFERIGQLYPAVEVPDGTKATVIAWIWARTVKCPNPACYAEIPLVRSFQLSTKEGREAWIAPEVDHSTKRIRFRIGTGPGTAPAAPKVGRGAKFRCLVCRQVSPDSHIKSEGCEGRMGTRLLAIVAEGKKGRVYLEPNGEHERIANSAQPAWMPNQELGHDPRNIWCVQYGIRRFQDLFTSRQLVALTTFSDLLQEARAQAIADGATEEYSDVISTYLGLGISRLTDACNANCTWSPNADQTVHLFTKHAIPMVWDFAESNVFAEAAGDFRVSVRTLAKALEATPSAGFGEARQLDATAIRFRDVVYSTDPPYFDNISYADLSDFFYVWLRKSLFHIYPDLFSTLLVPKAQELVASPSRFEGDNEKAEQFFKAGFSKAMEGMRAGQNQEYPLTIFYAFKQSETDNELQEVDTGAVTSTGWETMLDGLLRANFQITGTWPMRSERATRSVAQGTNALASSIVLVCRPRPDSAALTTRKDFLVALKRELGPAIKSLQLGNIAPVDLQQAAIGPGMAIFSRHKKVIESDGTPMRVRTALGLINQALDEALSEQESDYDTETRWALTWFEQNQFDEGSFGDANVLASAKALSVEGMQNAGLLVARAGKVRLLRREELSISWTPSEDKHLTVWKVTQHLIHRLAAHGQDEARGLVTELGGMADVARELAYRLYTLCERKGWAEEASYYNALVVAWPAIRSQEFALTGDK